MKPAEDRIERISEEGMRRKADIDVAYSQARLSMLSAKYSMRLENRIIEDGYTASAQEQAYLEQLLRERQ